MNFYWISFVWDIITIDLGVPQWSEIGPDQYVCYINEWLFQQTVLIHLLWSKEHFERRILSLFKIFIYRIAESVFTKQSLWKIVMFINIFFDRKEQSIRDDWEHLGSPWAVWCVFSATCISILVVQQLSVIKKIILMVFIAFSPIHSFIIFIIGIKKFISILIKAIMVKKHKKIKV